MDVKLIEIRDSDTMIPAIAIKLGARNEAEVFLLDQAGYGDPIEAGRYTLLARIDGSADRSLEFDAKEWAFKGSRTMEIAHRHLDEHWDEIKSGDIVDVEYLLVVIPAIGLVDGIGR